MKLLITGGTGFIGQLFIRHYPDYDYVVVSRQPERAKRLFQAHPKVTVIPGLHSLEHLNDFDGVINLAGEPIIDKRWSPEQKQRIEDSRWLTTDALVTLINASEQSPEVLLSGSAIGYYGDQGQTLVDESATAPIADFSANLCQEWERRAQAVTDRCRLVSLRTGIVLHPDFGALQRMWLPFKLGLGGPIGSGNQYYSWIHWQDMVQGMHYLLRHDECQGAFNMTAPTPLSNKAFSQALGRALHRPALMPMPGCALKLMLGESSELLLISQGVLPKRLMEAGYQFEYSQIDAAFQDLCQR